MIDSENINSLGKDPAVAKGNHPREQQPNPQRYFSVGYSDSLGNEIFLVV